MQLELAVAQVRPALDRLEQVAGDHRLEPFSRIGHASPVAQEPLRRLADGILDVAEPRAHLESVVEALEDADPVLDRLFVGLHLAGERPVDDLLAAPVAEQLGEDGELPEFRHAREVADVVAQELFVAKTVPARRKSAAPPREGLREAAELEQGGPVAGRQLPRGPDEPIAREGGVDQLGDGERVHPVGEVAPHQAVSAALVDVHPRGPRRENPALLPPDVEEALEECLPPSVLVDLVEHDERPRGGG